MLTLRQSVSVSHEMQESFCQAAVQGQQDTGEHSTAVRLGSSKYLKNQNLLQHWQSGLWYIRDHQDKVHFVNIFSINTKNLKKKLIRFVLLNISLLMRFRDVNLYLQFIWLLKGNWSFGTWRLLWTGLRSEDASQYCVVQSKWRMKMKTNVVKLLLFLLLPICVTTWRFRRNSIHSNSFLLFIINLIRPLPLIQCCMFSSQDAAQQASNSQPLPPVQPQAEEVHSEAAQQVPGQCPASSL